MVETIDWVRDPSLAPDGYKDSTVFVSAVTAIFEKDPDPAKVRDLLTYLLLRRNPMTSDPLPLEHLCEDPTTVPDTVVILRDSARINLERYLYPKQKLGRPYAQLQLIQLYVKSLNLKWSSGEEFALLVLSLCTLAPIRTTRDIFSVHACLKLYFDQVHNKPKIRECEFVEDIPRYTSWIYNEIDRLCELNYTNEERESELAYLGAFASLVRASRMMGHLHPVSKMLGDEVAKLKTNRLEQETSNVNNR